MADGNSIDAVIFDLGRVLVDIDLSAVTDIFSSLTDKDPHTVAQGMIADPLMVEYNSGRIEPEDFYRKLCDKYELKVDFTQFKKLWCGIFKPMDGMEELVRSLDGRYTLGMLSDTDPLHWGYLSSEYTYLEIFSKPTLSFQVGCMKPAAEIYLKAAAAVGAEPSRCLYVDDLQRNVDGAKRVGMDAIQFTGVDGLKEQLKARNVI